MFGWTEIFPQSTSYEVRSRSAKPTYPCTRSILLLDTRGPVLHHSAETVPCFRNHFMFFFFLSEYQQRVNTTCLWCRTGPVCLPQFFLCLLCPYKCSVMHSGLKKVHDKIRFNWAHFIASSCVRQLTGCAAVIRKSCQAFHCFSFV